MVGVEEDAEEEEEEEEGKEGEEAEDEEEGVEKLDLVVGAVVCEEVTGVGRER